MNMHIRINLLDGLADIYISLARVFRMYPTLEAHLAGAPVRGLFCPPHDFFMGKVIGFAAKVLAHFTF